MAKKTVKKTVKKKAVRKPRTQPDHREELFIMHYVLDPHRNGTKAAIAAGYAEKSADIQAVRLLSRARVAEAVKRLDAAEARRVAGKLEITADRIYAEMAAVAFARITDVLSFKGEAVDIRSSDSLSDNTLAAISEVSHRKTQNTETTSIKMHNKLGALETLLKQITGQEDEAVKQAPCNIVNFADVDLDSFDEDTDEEAANDEAVAVLE